MLSILLDFFQILINFLTPHETCFFFLSFCLAASNQSSSCFIRNNVETFPGVKSSCPTCQSQCWKPFKWYSLLFCCSEVLYSMYRTVNNLDSDRRSCCGSDATAIAWSADLHLISGWWTENVMYTRKPERQCGFLSHCRNLDSCASPTVPSYKTLLI